MSDGFVLRWVPASFRPRSARLDQEELAKNNRYLMDALTIDKREGHLLAVRARWVALAVIGIFIPFLNFSWEVLYYEFLLACFAFLGWVQLKAGQVGQSRLELQLLALDLILLTLVLVVPNPFYDEPWPTAMQYKFDNFGYFYVLLAAGTMAYSWRTMYAFGMWVSICWFAALALVIFFGTEYPEISEALAVALKGNEHILEFIDPNDPHIGGRIQEVVIFLIVVAILGLNGWRSNRLMLRQAEVARERANLARHFPPTIVDEIAERDQPLGSVRAQTVTVMFTDIVGFTRLAERQSPDQVIELLRRFHGLMEKTVFDHGGTLDKFLGDGIMATFGTPDPRPEDAANALKCAEAMLHEIDRWNQQRLDRDQTPIQLSIGVHRGEVVLGDIGSERRLEFATLGDAVNVASRLEALTRELNVRLIVSDAAKQSADDIRGPSDDGGYAAGGEHHLRGRDDPVRIWTHA